MSDILDSPALALVRGAWEPWRQHAVDCVEGCAAILASQSEQYRGGKPDDRYAEYMHAVCLTGSPLLQAYEAAVRKARAGWRG